MFFKNSGLKQIFDQFCSYNNLYGSHRWLQSCTYLKTALPEYLDQIPEFEVTWDGASNVPWSWEINPW